MKKYTLYLSSWAFFAMILHSAGAVPLLESSDALVEKLVEKQRLQQELIPKLQEAKKQEQISKEQLESVENNMKQATGKWGAESWQFQSLSKKYDEINKLFSSNVQSRESLERELKNTQNEIDQINKSLSNLIERGTVAQRQQMSYKIELQKQLVGKTPDEINSFLQDELGVIEGKIFYEDQKDDLGVFLSEARKSGLDELVNQAQERIEQIEEFQKNPPPAPANELEKKLGLHYKIEIDRYKAIAGALFEYIADLDPFFEREDELDIAALGKLVTDLDMLKGALARYSFGKSIEDKEYLNSLIEDLKIRSTTILRQANAEYKKTLEPSRRLLAVALDLKSPTMEETAEFVQQGADTVWQGLKSLGNWVLQTTDFYATVKRMAKNEKARAEKMREWGSRAEKAPEIAQAGVKFIDATEKGVRKARSWIQFFGADFVKTIVPNAYAKFEKFEKGIIPVAQEKAPVVKSVVDVVAGKVAAPFLLRAADLTEWFGKTLEQIGRQSPEDRQKQTKAKIAIEKARDLIEMERNRTPREVGEKYVAQVPGAAEPKTTYAALFQTVKAFFKGLAQDLIAFFKRKEPELIEIQNRYEKNRVAYLSALGFTQEAIQDGIAAQEIQDKLASIAFDKRELARITPYHDAFVKSMRDLANVAQEITDRMVATKANVDFLINAWDEVQVNQAPTRADLEKAPEYAIASMTDAIIQARDMRYAYLDAARNGVALLQEELKEMVPYQTGVIAQQMGQELATMLTGALADAMVDSITVSRAMDKQLANAQALIDKQISTAQPPSQEN
jgi:hypothetical protein